MRALVAAGFALLLCASTARAQGIDAGALMNWSCLNLQIGACVCGWPPHPCIKVTYNEPRLLIHTWATASGKPGHEGPQQFHEATVVPFPLKLFMDLFTFPCSVDYLAPGESLHSLMGGFSASANYRSFLDAVEWRTGATEMWAAQSIVSTVAGSLGACAFQGLASPIGITLPGLGDVCMGNWGPLFARTGWLMHPSEPVGSAAAAYRSAHILSHLELLAGHVVPQPALDFSASTADLMNLVVPRMTQCFAPGTPPITWEQATTSPIGQYLWVYWVKRSCCIDPAMFAAAPAGPRVAGFQSAPLPSTRACRVEPVGLTPVAWAVPRPAGVHR